MKLYTQINIQPEHNPIDYNSKVLLLGSCFVENIGDKLAYYKFNTLQNPFGIVFHPVAIEKLVTRALNETLFTEADLFFHNEQWHCFEVHSLLSDANKEAFLRKLNTQLKLLQEYLETATHFVFTYGTAWVYRFIETDNFVANCHKIPQKKFLKELFSAEAVAASIENTITLIKDVNLQATFVHTVSPVRHLKDGFVENTQSKAHLLAGLHELIAPKNRMHYFPSYELLLDELRDYRFYAEDMLHPNALAIAIIWERFNTAWIASETAPLQKEIDSIQSGLRHRPFYPESEAHQAFLKNLQQKIENFQQQNPHITL
ncbi:GSCFA domain-containing protein [Ulvibacter litoralis]|uniref:GSCFA family protein n=1 Tax=Ulvibacter litoralis TaxID=227084 RepID=A0A1G7C7T3_9FLAO|nr:GSCFA domain-containing protein [Ulvibacter litoralis]GHC48329.1 hypothetical protein GCM10008083_09570 [Ulvibacter litoralis]SDE35378.1 GSCFA family protein [Ulvibacter litoralis]